MFWNLIVQKYETLHLHHVLLLVFLLLYSILGAVIFCALEGDGEERLIRDNYNTYVRARKQMLTSLHSIYNGGKNSSLPPEGSLLQIVNDYNEQMGLTPSRDNRWTIWGGLYYAGTVYTTIGYGDMSTVTTGGRIFTCAYALLGVPMVITILNDWGTLFFNIVHKLWNHHIVTIATRILRWWKNRQRRKRTKLDDETALDGSNTTINSQSMQEEFFLPEEDAKPRSTEDEEDEPLPLLIVFFVFMVWWALCAVVFAYVESWTISESFYFFFISFVTVGFGDITPRHRTAVAGFLLIIIGLAIVSMTINVIQMHLERLFAQIVASIDSDFKTRMTESEQMFRRMSMEGNIGIQVDDAKTVTEHQGVKSEKGGDFIKGVQSNMQMSNKLLMKFMSNHQKKMLNEKFEDRNKMRNHATQTSIQIRVASVQTKDRDDIPLDIPEEEEEEEVITTQTTPDGRVVTTTRLVPKRKMYIYNTGD